MLIEAGCNLKNEKWLFEEPAQARIAETDLGKHFLAWLRSHVTKPVSLRSLARLVVRRQLGGQQLEAKVNLLNVPRYLKEYLLMKFWDDFLSLSFRLLPFVNLFFVCLLLFNLIFFLFSLLFALLILTTHFRRMLIVDLWKLSVFIL